MKSLLTEKDEDGSDRQNPVLPISPEGGEALTDRRAEVAILMCTYNGATYLREQLESFAGQSFTNWSLYVSDDASTDSTRSILADYQLRWGEERMKIFDGPRMGFGKNFISLIKRSEVDADYYAFSDQDDVWFEDKLERGIEQLALIRDRSPTLYCSRTRLINAQGKVTGFSPLFSQPPSFRNALVQSIAGANTMLINQSACNILKQIPENSTVVAHDWLAYLLVTGCGGQAFYDSKACLDYRQHGANLIGANAGLKSRAIRFAKMLSGRFIEWNDANLELLHAMSSLMTQEHRTTLQHFANARNLGIKGRLLGLYHSGVYRQSIQGNVSLIIAACFGRI